MASVGKVVTHSIRIVFLIYYFHWETSVHFMLTVELRDFCNVFKWSVFMIVVRGLFWSPPSRVLTTHLVMLSDRLCA